MGNILREIMAHHYGCISVSPPTQLWLDMSFPADISAMRKFARLHIRTGICNLLGVSILTTTNLFTSFQGYYTAED